MVLSLNILELGQRAITIDVTWLTTAVVRAVKMNKVVGGVVEDANYSAENADCWGVGWSSGGNPAGAQRGRLPALDHRAFYHFGPRWTSHLPVLARSVLNQTLPILLQRLEERYSKLEFQEIG